MSEVLKEYLIALGFKVDENGWQGFNYRITRAGQTLIHLGATTTAVATAIGVSVEKTARLYEDLYYVSQRTGSSVSTLKAYEFGAKQIGLTSDQARSSVENLAASIRMNPGMAGLLRGMGIDPSNSQRAVLELTGRLRQQFGAGGYFVAARMAGMYGIDEGTFKQLWDNLPRLQEAQKQSAQFQREAGVNADDAAKKFTDFARASNVLYEKLGLVKDRIAIDYLPQANWVVKVGGQLVDYFNEANTATDGWTGKIFGLAAGFSAVRIALVPLLSLLGFGGASGVLTRILGLGGVLSFGGMRALALGGGIGGAALGVAGAVKADSNTGNTLRSSLRSMLGIQDPNEVSRFANLATRRDAAVSFFQKQGWSREQAIGIAANLASESRFNPNSVGDGGQAYGIAQWHPDRQAAFARWAGKDIRDSTLEEQLAFVNYELTQGNEQGAGRALRGARTARESGSIVSRMYERPGDVFGQAGRRGALAQNWSDTVLKSDGGAGDITISPVTHTTITGVSDPKKAADLVGKENDRANGNLVRWGRGAIDNGVPAN